MSDTNKPDDITDDTLTEPIDGDDNAIESQSDIDTILQPITPAKRGIGWGGASVLFLLASLLGAAGGWGAVHYVTPSQIETTQAPSVDLTPLTTRLEQAEKTLSGQGAQLKLLQNEINNRPASIEVRAKPSPSSEGAVATTRVELDAQSTETIKILRDQINEMETALQTLRDDMTAQKAVDTTGVSEPTNVTGPKADEVARDIVEQKMSPLVNEVDALRVRIDELEQGLGETRAMAATPMIVKEPVLLPAFPRGAVFDALTTAPQEADAGWMAKTLKKHISVRNPEDVKRAERKLDNIAEAIETGQIAQAISLVEAMPQDVQDKAADWLAAAKRQN